MAHAISFVLSDVIEHVGDGFLLLLFLLEKLNLRKTMKIPKIAQKGY